MTRVLFALILVALIMACSHKPAPIEEAPIIDIQPVTKEVPCIVEIDAVERNPLPDYPAFDENDPVGWAREIRRVHKLREVATSAEIEALRHQIAEHNKLEPKCSE